MNGKLVEVILPNGLLWFPKASTRDAVTLTRCRDARLYSSWNLIVDTPSLPTSAAAPGTELQSAAKPLHLELWSSSMEAITYPSPSCTTRRNTGCRHRISHHIITRQSPSPPPPPQPPITMDMPVIVRPIYFYQKINQIKSNKIKFIFSAAGNNNTQYKSIHLRI